MTATPSPEREMDNNTIMCGRGRESMKLSWQPIARLNRWIHLHTNKEIINWKIWMMDSNSVDRFLERRGRRKVIFDVYWVFRCCFLLLLVFCFVFIIIHTRRCDDAVLYSHTIVCAMYKCMLPFFPALFLQIYFKVQLMEIVSQQITLHIV